MQVVMSLNGHILDGWERGQTSNGAPYYINHKDASTQWDHPEWNKLLQEFGTHNGIKYAAYRTAEKIKHLVNALRFNFVRWTMIDQALVEHGHHFVGMEKSVSYPKLESLLFTLCEMGQTDTFCTGQSSLHAELLLNILLNMFDKERRHGVNVVSATIFLAVLCSGKLLEKYKYISHRLIDQTGFIPRHHLQTVLLCLAKIPEMFGEKLSFGCHLVPATLESCCKQNSGMSEDSFLQWLFREPQTLVWLPTYARLKAAELVVHPVRCTICKLSPIVGMRYCCLRCLRYDTCQSCFFRGRVSKTHKLAHPMREFCQPTTSWEETKTLLKTLKNKMSRLHSSPNIKPSYLPISIPDSVLTDSDTQSSSSDRDSWGSTKCNENRTSAGKSSRTPTTLGFEHQRELESIIVRLENENRHISQEIGRFNLLTETGSSGESRSSRGSWDNPPNPTQAGLDLKGDNLQVSRQELLEDHTETMNVQIKRLRQLLQYLTRDGLENVSAGFRTSPESIHTVVPQPWKDPGSTEHPPIPPHQWPPFAKLQSELNMLEQLTSGLHESSNDSTMLKPNPPPSFIPGTQIRRSCRGVSFTDRYNGQNGPCGNSKQTKSPTFKRQGSVKTNAPAMGPSFSTNWYNSSSSVHNSSSRKYPSSCSRNANNCGKCCDHSVGHPCTLPAGTVKAQDSRVGSNQLEPFRADVELQAIIDQLEKVLPNSWSSTPSLLPEEKFTMTENSSEWKPPTVQFHSSNTRKDDREICRTTKVRFQDT